MPGLALQARSVHSTWIQMFLILSYYGNFGHTRNPCPLFRKQWVLTTCRHCSQYGEQPRRDKGPTFRGFRSEEEEQTTSRKKDNWRTGFQTVELWQRKLESGQAWGGGGCRVSSQSQPPGWVCSEPQREWQEGTSQALEYLGTEYSGGTQPERNSQSGNKGTRLDSANKKGLSPPRSRHCRLPATVSFCFIIFLPQGPHICCSPAWNVPFPTSSLASRLNHCLSHCGDTFPELPSDRSPVPPSYSSHPPAFPFLACLTIITR